MTWRRDQGLNPQTWIERRQCNREKIRKTQPPMSRKLGYTAHKSFSKTLKEKLTP